MNIIDELLRNAYEDTQVLISNDQLGDILAIPRDVDFQLYAPNEEQARIVCSFVNDNQYGDATVHEHEGRFGVHVVIHMPVTQHVICSVSALMCFLAKTFGLEYDGWGSPIQRAP